MFSSAFKRTLRASGSGVSIAAAASIQQRSNSATPLTKSWERSRKMHSKVVSKFGLFLYCDGGVVGEEDGDADVMIVIGSGPAAHTAAVYLSRAELKREFVLVLEERSLEEMLI